MSYAIIWITLSCIFYILFAMIKHRYTQMHVDKRIWLCTLVNMNSYIFSYSTLPSLVSTGSLKMDECKLNEKAFSFFNKSKNSWKFDANLANSILGAWRQMPYFHSVVKLMEYHEVWISFVNNLKPSKYVGGKPKINWVQRAFSSIGSILENFRCIFYTSLNCSRVHEMLPKHSMTADFCISIRMVGSIRFNSIGYKYQSNWMIASSILMTSSLPRCPISQAAKTKTTDQNP